MTITSAIAGLCAAIDGGDDAVLPILADALDDAGEHAVAVGLRAAISTDLRPGVMYPGTERQWGFRCDGRLVCVLPRAVFDRLPREGAVWRAPFGSPMPDRISYPTRSAAYLALAAALTEMPTREPG